MQHRPLTLLAAAAAAALSCATPSPGGTPVPLSAPAPGAVAPADFKASGEVFLSTGGGGASAAFDDFTVLGPRVNLVRQGVDRWAGDLVGRNLLLTVEAGHITGVGVNLHVARNGKLLRVEGTFGRRQIRLDLGPDAIQGTTTSSQCSLDVKRDKSGVYRGWTGCQGALAGSMTTLRLADAAADLENPVFPQVVLALIAVLP